MPNTKKGYIAIKHYSMKQLLALLLVIFSYLLNAQGPTWYWANGSHSAQGSSNFTGQEGTDVSANAIDGGAYGVGYMLGDSAMFGNFTVHNPYAFNGGCGYLIRYDAAGNIKWLRQACSKLKTVTYSVTSDRNGNAYITGTVEGDSIHFDNTIAIANPSQYSNTFFLAKYDSSGNFIWARIVNHAEPTSVACDASGNICVTGNYSGSSVSFGGQVLTGTAGINNVFVAKYDPTGNAIWARGSFVPASLHNDNNGSDISVNSTTNDVYITGYFDSPYLVLGGDTIRCAQDSGIGGLQSCEIFLARFDSTGQMLWLKSPKVKVQDFTFLYPSVAADKAGNAYITGGYDESSIIFDNDTLPMDATWTDLYFARYDINGHVKWCKSGTGKGLSGRSVSADDWGNIYFTGCYSNGVACVIDSLTFPNPNSSYADPIYILKCDSLGNILCSANVLAGGDDWSSTSPDHYGNVYLTSDYGLLSLAVGGDTLPPVSAGNGESQYMIKFSCGTIPCAPGPVTINADNDTICANDSARICAPQGYASYMWNTGQTTQCIYTSNAGNYYVTVTDNLGCSAVSNHLPITVHPVPLVRVTVQDNVMHVYNGVTQQWYWNGQLLPGDTLPLLAITHSGYYTVTITDSNGCVNISNPLAVGIKDDNSAALKIQVYPNPLSAGDWNLDVDPDLLNSPLDIYDEHGRMIYHTEIRATHVEIELNVAHGIYMLRVTSTGNTFVRKLVKL